VSSKAKTGPGRSGRKGRSASGRTTAKGSPGQKVGRYQSAEETGRYTAPIPAGVKRSPRWFGIAVLVALLLGVLVILLNYLTVLPGSVSVWYLVGGLVLIFVGFMMATRYR
jgi:hypothetical protein